MHLHWASSEGIWNVLQLCAHGLNQGGRQQLLSETFVKTTASSPKETLDSYTKQRGYSLHSPFCTRDRLDFWRLSTMTGSTSHSKFWGILSLSRLSAKSQHTTWGGFLLRAILTNHPGWEQHFLSLCLLIGVSQQDHRKVVQAVDKEWAWGFNTGGKSSLGRFKYVKMYVCFIFFRPSSIRDISTCISEFLQWRDTGNTQQGNHHHPLEWQCLWNNCLQLSKRAQMQFIYFINHGFIMQMLCSCFCSTCVHSVFAL